MEWEIRYEKGGMETPGYLLKKFKFLSFAPSFDTLMVKTPKNSSIFAQIEFLLETLIDISISFASLSNVFDIYCLPLCINHEYSTCIKREFAV